MNRDARQVLTEWLVLRAQEGDERAFADLYALWSDELRRLATAQVETSQHATEVVQDTWINIARGLRRLDDPACFPRWAFRILDRRCADWIRRRQRERQRATPVLDDAESPPPAERSPSDSEDAIALREAIARLDADARRLLHLFYDNGLSVAEVADVLGVPSGTVKSRLFALRESLKQQLERMKT